MGEYLKDTFKGGNGFYIDEREVSSWYSDKGIHLAYRTSAREDVSDAKLETIRTRGVPFASLVWLPGHIGLYLGVDEHNEPLMLHNLWGLRTALPDGVEGRAVAGKLSISTLRPGEDRPDIRRGAFLERIRGLTLLGAGVSVR